MKHLLLIGLLLLAALRVAAQTQNVDSLVNVLKTQKLTNKEQMDIDINICSICNYSDIERMKIYAQEGLSLAEKDNDKRKISSFNMYLGYWYSKKSIYDTAISSFNKALNAEVDEEQKAAIYTAIAEMYSFQNNFALSIEYLIKALPVYEKANDKYKYMKILANIGGLYRSAYNYEKAYTYIKKANDIAKELNSKEGIAKTCMDLGGININRGNFKEALALEHEALSAVKIAGNKSFEYGILQAIAIIYYYNTSNLINYDSALVYAKKAEQIAEEFGEKQMTYNAMETMASIYREQGRYKECEDASLKAWAIDSANITEAPALAANIIISSIYLDKRDQAKHFFWKYTEMVNQFNDESNHKTMIELETKYETQKKEMRIASLEKERRLYVWLGAAGVLLLISLGLILLQTQRNAKKKRRIIASEALLEGEIEERARIAKDLHDRLGGSLSAVKIELQSAESLQHVSDKLDECIKEVREITHNLMPRSLRLFGMKGALEDFSAQFPNVHFYFHGKEQRIKERLEFIVYCCANELVTNSIRYSGSENINIQLIQSEKHVSLTVQDDGCGFDEKTVTTGIGLKNIRDRIAACNGKLDIASAPGNGTETTIELKIES